MPNMWEPLPDPLFGGVTHFRRGLPDPADCATAYVGGNGPKAIAWVSRHFVCVLAPTVEEAMRCMDRKIARLIKEH